MSDPAADPLRALLALSRAMHASDDARATFDVIVREAIGFLRADRAALFARDRVSGRRTVLASQGLSHGYLAEVDRFYERSAGGLAAALRRPLLIADVLVDPRVAPELREAAGHEGFRAQLILPLGPAGTSLGGLTLYWDAQPSDDGLLPVDVDLAQLFSDQAGVALAHALALDAAQARFDAPGRSETAIAARLTAGGVPVALSGGVGTTLADDHNAWVLEGPAGAIRLRDWSLAERRGADGVWSPAPDALPNDRMRPMVLARQLDGVAAMTRGQPHHLATLREALEVQEMVEAILAQAA